MRKIHVDWVEWVELPGASELKQQPRGRRREDSPVNRVKAAKLVSDLRLRIGVGQGYENNVQRGSIKTSLHRGDS